MPEGWSERALAIDRSELLVQGLLPAVGTIVAMAVGFALVMVVLFVREPLIVGSMVTQLLALSIMLLVPQFVVGLVMGSRYGLSVGPPVAAALAPVVVLVIALAAFGGPVGIPLSNIPLTVGAIVAWGLACAGGLVVGARVLAPRLGDRSIRSVVGRE